MQRIYLDYAAATPVDSRVLDAMMPYFSNVFQNPSALYEEARKSKSALEDARSRTARLIGAKPSEIIFTAGGTESANLAVHGVMKSFTDGNLLVSAIEHDAVIKPASDYESKTISVDNFGRVNTDEIEKICNEKTVLISVMLANNEIGTIQPIKEISEIVNKIRISRKINKNNTPIYLHVDACQAPLYLEVNVARLGLDMMTLNGGKIHGPKQSGILYIKAGTILKPIIDGGGQEWGYRSGTENVAFAVGFAKALEFAEKGKAERTKNMIKLRDFFIRELEHRFNAEISGHKSHRLANNVHAIFAGIDNERVLFALDDLGVSAAAGSACSASSVEASHVLLALGKKPVEARSSLRFSFGSKTSLEELEKTLDFLKKALKA